MSNVGMASADVYPVMSIPTTRGSRLCCEDERVVCSIHVQPCRSSEGVSYSPAAGPTCSWVDGFPLHLLTSRQQIWNWANYRIGGRSSPGLFFGN